MDYSQQFDDDVAFTRYEYEDTLVLAADFGPGRDVTVDLLGDTAIVVVDGQQHELTLPSTDARAFIHNGVLTIEVNA
jgi:hypothetical protein